MEKVTETTEVEAQEEIYAPDIITVITIDGLYSTNANVASDRKIGDRKIEPYSFEYWEGGMGGVKFLVKDTMVILPYTSIKRIEHSRG